MSEIRSNMVSLLDFGAWLGGTTTDIRELGDGINELNEDWGPDVESKQYINMSAKSSTVKGYELSIDVEREFIDDENQEVINKAFKTLPTGKKCETHYYRYLKTDITDGVGDCIRVPVIVVPSSLGGSGEDVLSSGLQIKGNGEVELGTITISDSGYTWEKKTEATASTSEATEE